MPKRKRPLKDVYAAHSESAARVCGGIRIRKSRIGAAGGGAFTTLAIQRGACIGFYRGARGSTSAKTDRDYVMDGERGGRDGKDPDGRLVLGDGSVVDVHGFSSEDWSALHQDGVSWRGVSANWTRFINHANGSHTNVAVCATSTKYGKSHALYAKTDIAAGQELFFSYGSGWWRSRGLTPMEPAPPTDAAEAPTEPPAPEAPR
ncbi:hypothetical protein M885DRAFT_522616 [Pelagophyceae sp. CCMP2097]|nr:hypothetical protein M885DRAFT_522616 [Pelagophyceae sp. CCMP2097]